MKILSMTATFGKLENQTLALKPDLNVLCAPNEWGKSTWCAFLTAMLYGIDTGARSKKGVLADKERYAPWSGAPMSGRMEIDWNGRRITIERRAKGRTPMGDFSAYETDTGLPVSELSATTCGEVLLGVERSVFQRAGFIQLSDLPVTQDESLRRRLNALVTTGDENSAADDLAQKLKDLKNKCRFNRSGLLPQAEAQRAELERTLTELQELQSSCQRIQARQQELEAFSAALENHKLALAFAAAEADRLRVRQAAESCDAAARRLAAAEKEIIGLPSEAEAEERLQQAALLLTQERELQLQAPLLPPLPQPLAQGEFASVEQAQADLAAVQKLEAKKRKNGLLVGIYAAAAVLLLASLLIPAMRSFGALIGILIALGGIGVLTLCALRTKKIRDQLDILYQRYPGLSPDKWLPEAQRREAALRDYAAALASATTLREDWQRRKAAFDQQLAAFTQGKSLAEIQQTCENTLASHKAYFEAQQNYERAVQRAEELRAMAKTAPKPQQPDALSYSAAETERFVNDTAFELRQLHTHLGQNLGKMEALGNAEALQQQLDAVNARIDQLSKTYNALELALRTLSEASASLQRRFAPRISTQAQDIFSRLTGGRYSRLSLSEDLSIQAGSEAETTLRPALWRSEGTMDQLYLSLRLAVARELTPQAPLILDDAFARFDDTRLEAAMDILKEEAENRQIILFSCQNREEALI